MESDSRVDLFISFHGSQKIAGGQYTTLELVRKTHEAVLAEARRNDRHPSIFFYENSLHSEMCSIYDAILQTRGGGVALFLLTPEFFRQTWCLTELRAFLHVRHRGDIKFLFLCVEGTPESIFQDRSVMHHVPELQEYRVFPGFAGAMSEKAVKISDLIWHVWNAEGDFSARLVPSVLGKSCLDCFLHLESVFSSADVPRMRTVFGISPQNASTVTDVLSMAREKRLIGDRDVTRLYKVITYGTSAFGTVQHNAVEAYERKWVNTRLLGWGSDIREELRKIYDRSARDIRQMHGGSDARTVQSGRFDEVARGDEGGDAHFYEVKPGDTLSKIAVKQLGKFARYPEIFELNRDQLDDPDFIYPGLILRLPKRW